MSDVLNEITPLSEKDCFYVVERHKTQFDYPLHQHGEYEINFIEHGAGAQRVVGDSVEEIGEYDLVLIGGENLEHVWQQGSCHSDDIREITIQFSNELFSDNLLAKNQFSTIRDLLLRAEHGLSFGMSTIMKVYSTLNTIASTKEKFVQFLNFLYLMYQLSIDPAPTVLASSSFAHTERSNEGHRVALVKQYINDHYAEDLNLNALAGLASMTPSAFSRFFKLRTGRTLSDYILDIKLGYAARLLVDTSKNISEICFECGFNNQSNFNRIFKSKRGLTPREFRAMFKKNKVLV